MSVEHMLKVVHPFNRTNLFYEVRQTLLLSPSFSMSSSRRWNMQGHLIPWPKWPMFTNTSHCSTDDEADRARVSYTVEHGLHVTSLAPIYELKGSMLDRTIEGYRMLFSFHKWMNLLMRWSWGRPATLDRTLKEWEIGGNGEGVDVVCMIISVESTCIPDYFPRFVLRLHLVWGSIKVMFGSYT